MDTLWREIRYTFRRLARSPTTSLAAVITMALGIGAATGAQSGDAIEHQMPIVLVFLPRPSTSSR